MTLWILSVEFALILTTVRFDHQSYLISNLTICIICQAVGPISEIMLINTFSALKGDFQEIGDLDSFCNFPRFLKFAFYIHVH